MTTATVDLRELVAGMAGGRGQRRSEADLQAQVRDLLLYGGLSLADDQVVLLESPVTGQRRIDIEVGCAVIECKRDLRTGNIFENAVPQLAGYVSSRSSETGQRYVGVLTDGVDWMLYHLDGGKLKHVSTLVVDPAQPDVDGLRLWLDGVMATSEPIAPTPAEIERRLGVASTAYALDFAELTAIYRQHADMATVQVKRELWGKLLRTALGTSFRDEEELFVAHTLLVAMADVIGHAVIGADPSQVAPASLLAGHHFTTAQIGNVVESDFFDWPLDTGQLGQRFVGALARRLSRFDWAATGHDVMKILYESVIAAKERHGLGEYYTPDWLAQSLIEAVDGAPLDTRILDPSCGSGTFLFWAVRNVVEAAEASGMSPGEAVGRACDLVYGVDVHPVAVTLARVTYLLALGTERLGHADRPAISVPVYLGDTVGWAASQATLFTSDALAVPTRDDDSGQLFSTELRFPEHLFADAGRFDQFVNELTKRATARPAGKRPLPSLDALFRRYGIAEADQPMIEETFAVLCTLYDDGRDHIWGYYVRNLARPAWLSRGENRVDALVGNPPWLSYQFMPPSMQGSFRRMSTERGLWAGAQEAPHMDLSGLFVVRAVERYLRTGGRFGFVLPLAALSRGQFAGFRSGEYNAPDAVTTVSFEASWDLHLVKPRIFRVPPSVVVGAKTDGAVAPLVGPGETWSGRLASRNVALDLAGPRLTKADAVARRAPTGQSLYHDRFSQGATMTPRMLVIVEQTVAPLGAGAGRTVIRSRRSANEKAPWKTLAPLEGSVESIFIRPLHLGETVLPFRTKEPLLALVPWDGKQLLGDDDRIEMHPGLAEWWRRAEEIWMAHRKTKSERMSLLQRLDYRRGLALQFPPAPHRVVYTSSGMYLAATRVSDERVVVDTKLYWAATGSVEEACYLEAILNSECVTLLVRPLQSRGEHNPRDFHKFPLDLPVPEYDAGDDLHTRLAARGGQAEELARAVELPMKSFEAQRRRIREALAASEVGQEIEALVRRLLAVEG